MDKQEIRRQILVQLKGLSSGQRARVSQELTDRLVARADYQVSSRIATFLSLPHEWDTSYLIDHAQAAGKEVFIPKTYAGGRMVFAAYQPNQLVKTSFGTWEPGTYAQVVDKSVLNWIQVPGLAWNQEGFRVGYGGGFYDRYLADFEGVTLSTLSAFQSLSFQPEMFDQAVKEMIVYEEVL